MNKIFNKNLKFSKYNKIMMKIDIFYIFLKCSKKLAKKFDELY